MVKAVLVRRDLVISWVCEVEKQEKEEKQMSRALELTIDQSTMKHEVFRQNYSKGDNKSFLFQALIFII